MYTCTKMYIYVTVFSLIVYDECGKSRVLLGGERGGGGERGHLPPLSQRDLPHILPDEFSYYPPRFLVCAVRPPLSSFLK